MTKKYREPTEADIGKNIEVSDNDFKDRYFVIRKLVAILDCYYDKRFVTQYSIEEGILKGFQYARIEIEEEPKFESKYPLITYHRDCEGLLHYVRSLEERIWELEQKYNEK